MKTKKMQYSASFEARVDFNKDMRRAETANLEDSQAARAEWLDALRNSADTVIERIEWLLDGNYGWGAYECARETITNTRMNRSAWLGQVIANLEWQCPSNFAREAWNKLDGEKQENITAAINDVIDTYLKAMAEEQAA